MTQSNKNKQNSFSLRKFAQTTNKSTLAFSALSMPALLMAQSAMAADDEEVVLLDTMQIEERTVDTNPYAEAGAPYKAKVSGDSRHVKPLAETPQTISVLTQTQIQESGRSDLKQILQGQPGITLGTGENGNAFGDRYVIRGHEARSDVFVDGLRDPGMTTRESFATEQVEVTKGPSSTFAGRGSTGGAINSITKQASTEYDFTKAQFGIGTDKYSRITLDSNQKINDELAVRANLLYSTQDVPDRSPADKERTGVALSAAYSPTDKLELIADYYYLKAEDKPDLGTYIVAGGGKPVDDIAVYVQDEDFLTSTVDTFTFRTNYEVSDDLRIENSLRYGTTDNGYVVTGARGTTRHESDPDAPGADTIGLSTHQGWQEVKYLVDQFNVIYDTELSGMAHNFIFSAEYSELNVINGTYKATAAEANSNCKVSGRGGVSDGYCIIDANGNYIDNIGSLMNRDITKDVQDSDYNVDTISLSVMDTVEINDQLSAFFGVRVDNFDYSNVLTRNGESTRYEYSDTLWNGHLGFVYQLTDEGNIYATYSTSTNINGGESDVGGSCGYGGLCGDTSQVTESKPEKTENIELGTKWNLMDEKLLATAAIFQITKKDVMESVGDDDYELLGTLNTGENRVKGIEFSLSGNISEQLSAQFGVALMDSEILKAYDESGIGRALSNFAEDSAFLQLRYQATDAFSFGGVVTYSSELYAGQPDSAAGYNTSINDYSYTVPSYASLDLFASYEFSEQLKVRLNINNATNNDYYMAAYRSGAFAYIGDARNAYLTVAYEF